MPHQCTTCGRTFADGSKEMLSGCPDCGGNKFQFHPDGDVETADPDGTPSPPEDGGLADAAARAGAAVRDRLPGSDARSPPSDSRVPPDRRDPVGGDAGPDTPASVHADTREGTDRPGPDESAPEDSAQADARTDVVSPEELPSTPDRSARDPPAEEPPDADGEVVDTPTPERPGLEELRAELNDQFESIRVVNPGEYELNLMELYDSQEYIISLQEDGRYVIEVPDTWADEE